MLSHQQFEAIKKVFEKKELVGPESIAISSPSEDVTQFTRRCWEQGIVHLDFQHVEEGVIPTRKAKGSLGVILDMKKICHILGIKIKDVEEEMRSRSRSSSS